MKHFSLVFDFIKSLFKVHCTNSVEGRGNQDSLQGDI